MNYLIQELRNFLVKRTRAWKYNISKFAFPAGNECGPGFLSGPLYKP